MTEIFGLEFQAFVLGLSLVFFILVLAITDAIIEQGKIDTTYFKFKSGWFLNNKVFKMIHYSELLRESENEKDLLLDESTIKETLRLKDLSPQIKESLNIYQQGSKRGSGFHQDEIKIPMIKDIVKQLIVTFLAFLLAPFMLVLIYLERNDSLNGEEKLHLTQSTDEREAIIVSSLLILLSSVTYVIVGFFKIISGILNATLNLPGVPFFLVDWGCIVCGIIGIAVSLNRIITSFWRQYQWKFFWKRQFLLQMNGALNQGKIERYLQLKNCCNEIDTEPIFVLFKQLGSIALVLGFIQILTPIIGNILGLI
ncbi:MAG: hypothetical protein ACXADY_10555 [Candidatus Hodarchaeales archaeon]|jgi:hypothetical protein